jgi:hypothetical protein
MVMKKAAYISVTILEILCLAGAWAIQYFTRRKMGMARYVVYKNRSWEAHGIAGKWGCASDGGPDRDASSLFPETKKEPDKNSVAYECRYDSADICLWGIYMDEFSG